MTGSYFSWTCFREWGKDGGPLKWRVPIWGEFRKWSDHRKKSFFISNSVEVLIPLKEVHQDLLKLHVHLGGIPENCRNTLSCIQLTRVDQIARSAKTLTLLCTINCLQRTPLLISWKNLKIQVWL